MCACVYVYVCMRSMLCVMYARYVMHVVCAMYDVYVMHATCVMCCCVLCMLCAVYVVYVVFIVYVMYIMYVMCVMCFMFVVYAVYVMRVMYVLHVMCAMYVMCVMCVMYVMYVMYVMCVVYVCLFVRVVSLPYVSLESVYDMLTLSRAYGRPSHQRLQHHDGLNLVRGLPKLALLHASSAGSLMSITWLAHEDSFRGRRRRASRCRTSLAHSRLQAPMIF